MNQQVTKTERMQDLMPRNSAGSPATQASSVEHSRAIAQVQAACVMARHNPRDEIAAAHRMRAACANIELAMRAFFKFPRGGTNVTGASIHLATEIGRCWGNLDYGIVELSRDDVFGESEMMAYAWDLETNNRVVNTFVVPHKRDKKGGPEILTDMRDIYENNANAAARRLRECIFRVLPKSYVEEAKRICTGTIERGDETPVEKRREQMLQAFAKIGVNRKQIEKKMGGMADRFTPHDLAILTVTLQSIRNGETTAEDEFDIDVAGDVAETLKGKPEAEKQGQPKDEPKPKVETEAKAKEAPSRAAAETENPEPEVKQETKDAAWLSKLKEAVGKARTARDVESAMLKARGHLDDFEKRDPQGYQDLSDWLDDEKRAVAMKEEDQL